MSENNRTIYEQIHIHFDGGCDVNPGGIPSFGWQVYSYSHGSGTILHEGAGVVTGEKWCHRTNNTAEWAGALDALAWIKENNIYAGSFWFVGDSMLILKQLTGEWRTKQEHHQRYYDEAMSVLKKHCKGKWKRRWVPRERNWYCDQLAQKARDSERNEPAIFARDALDGKKDVEEQKAASAARGRERWAKINEKKRKKIH